MRLTNSLYRRQSSSRPAVWASGTPTLASQLRNSSLLVSDMGASLHALPFHRRHPSRRAELSFLRFNRAYDKTWEGAMNPNTVIPNAPREKSAALETDMVDQVGNAILEFVIHSGETTQTELQ